MHMSPDTLTLLALGEPAATPDEQAHLVQCPVCTAHLEELARVVTFAREPNPPEPLSSPGPEVWARIQAALQEPVEIPSSTQVDEVIAAVPVSAPPASISPAPVRSSRARRAAAFVLVAAFALIAGLGIGFGASRFGGGTPQAAPDPVTHLNALPGWPGAQGQASITTGADGVRTLKVSMSMPQPLDGRLQVWLSDEEALHMTPMGYLTDGSGSFTMPASMDLKANPIVDVSEEPINDSDSDHSLNSVVRGRLVR
ncbi:MAG TPA: anti-sigma factor [Propionibacteriaceae bacterium]